MERGTVARIAGEELVLHPERAAFWERESTLFVADLHFGKAAAFRELAIPVPAGTSEGNYNRLDALVRVFRPERIVLLGDLWHAREGRTPEALDRLAAWRSRIAAEVILVVGNHDRRAGELPASIGIESVPEPFRLGPWALCHYPQQVEQAYVLAGHLHPRVRFEGAGRQTIGLPCFWFQPRCGVLPAFGEFTGTALVLPKPEDQVFVIAEGSVHPITSKAAGVCA